MKNSLKEIFEDPNKRIKKNASSQKQKLQSTDKRKTCREIEHELFVFVAYNNGK